jgi:hypothetical protein
MCGLIDTYLMKNVRRAIECSGPAGTRIRTVVEEGNELYKDRKEGTAASHLEIHNHFPFPFPSFECYTCVDQLIVTDRCSHCYLNSFSKIHAGEEMESV